MKYKTIMANNTYYSNSDFLYLIYKHDESGQIQQVEKEEFLMKDNHISVFSITNYMFYMLWCCQNLQSLLDM